MSYKEFMETVLGILGEHGIDSRVRFFIDDKGRYKALVDRISITGNSTNVSLTVKWASHTAMFSVA